MTHAFAVILACWLAATAPAPSSAAAAAATATQPGRQIVVTADRGNGVYAVGETIRWRVERKGSRESLQYVIRKGGLSEVARGAVVPGEAVEARLDAPGTLLLEVTGDGARALGGAVAAPQQIAPAAPRPDDFDEFWDAKVRELAAVAPNPKLTPADSGKAGVEYFKITLDNIRGTKIRGQLARPSRGGGGGDKKLPALLIVQWAGVYPLQKSWVTDRAAEGWLVLNILPHDLPIDEPESFYKQQAAGPLRDYWSIGNDDRDASYFLRMYLSCHRAADYLAQRDDWDGRTLAVNGGSQGGQQALVTAALHPKVTAAMAIVPAGCDMRGPDAGRVGGWPQWHGRVDGKEADKVRRTSEYFDVANFAPRVRCPVLVGVGLIDEVCPPAGILAATNQLRAPKEVILLPQGDHGNTGDSHEPYTKRCWQDWLPALCRGEAAPVAPADPGVQP